MSGVAFPVKSPSWVLVYRGVNITTDISSMVLSINYVDQLGGCSGDLEIEIEDRERLWQGPWFPQQGDIATLLIGYAGEPLLACGTFQVDDLELKGPPDVFHVRCLPTWITPSLRTANSLGYESQTLSGIAATVAARHGMSVVDAPGAIQIRYLRITQKQETDLQFLHRLAREHDYDFAVRGTQLVFYPRSQLQTRAPALTLERQDVIQFDFVSKTHQTYHQSQVSYFDSHAKQLYTKLVGAQPAVVGGDTLKLVARCENEQQASDRAQAALHERNRLLVTGHLVAPGTALAVAGNNVSLSGWGAMDGTYIIERAQHHLERATGYTTHIDVRRIAVT